MHTSIPFFLSLESLISSGPTKVRTKVRHASNDAVSIHAITHRHRR